MEKYKRQSVFEELKNYDRFAEENDFIEVTLWHNGEGFDVVIDGKLPLNFQITWGCYKALKKMVKKLNKCSEEEK